MELDSWEQVRLPGASPTTDLRFLAEHVLHEAVNAFIGDCVGVEFGLDARTGRRQLRVAPANLVGVVWLQFARSLAGDKRYGQCRHCGGHFELLAKYRGHREFCSTSCKLKAYRKRKQQPTPKHPKKRRH